MSRYLDITNQYRKVHLFDETLMAITVDNILALAADDLMQYRTEVVAAALSDPWRDHDTEALRRADAIRNRSEAAE